MPSTGMSSSSSSRRSFGAPGAYTEAGPPDRTRAAGRRARMASSDVSCGSISAKTPQSRIRRAINWEYCPPKSRTSTSSRSAATARSSGVISLTAGEAGSAGSPGASSRAATPWSLIRSCHPRGNHRTAVRAHADRLLTLELLALGLQRRRDHHLGALEVADVLVAAGGHRGTQRADQVERAVVFVGGAVEDLVERAVLDGRHASPPRQRRMERRHPPVVATARSFLGPRERRADHHRVGAAGNRLREVPAGPHPA